MRAALLPAGVRSEVKCGATNTGDERGSLTRFEPGAGASTFASSIYSSSTDQRWPTTLCSAFNCHYTPAHPALRWSIVSLSLGEREEAILTSDETKPGTAVRSIGVHTLRHYLHTCSAALSSCDDGDDSTRHARNLLDESIILANASVYLVACVWPGKAQRSKKGFC